MSFRDPTFKPSEILLSLLGFLKEIFMFFVRLGYWIIPFIGLGIGTWIGEILEGNPSRYDDLNSIDLGILPAVGGFMLGMWVAYKIMSRNKPDDYYG